MNNIEGTYNYRGNTLTLLTGDNVGYWDNYTEIVLNATNWELEHSSRYGNIIEHEKYTKIQ